MVKGKRKRKGEGGILREKTVRERKCECVCVREREREKEGDIESK